VATTLRSILLRRAVGAVLVLSGCGDGISAGDESTADIYAVAIRWLVEDSSDSGIEKVFVEGVGDEAIALGVEVEVVNRLRDALTIRFIDSRDEAIDISEPGDPVRGDGVLIGLGSLPDVERPPVRLYVDRYRNVHEVAAYEVVLDRRGGNWQVTGDPTPVPVEHDRAAP
jgi:hypothetical protein